MSTIHNDSIEEDQSDARPKAAAGSLWHNAGFLKFWGGQTISMFGSQVTMLALPLIASLTLKATPAQMALLIAVGYAPSTLVGLFAGVWVDRTRRRPIMIWADLGRTLLLLLLPIAAVWGLLRIELLYAAAFLTSILGVFFGTAYGAFVPSLVPRQHLVEAYSRLATSDSVARIAGPSLAGLLVQLLTAPLAVAVDAVSFVVSALSLSLIRTSEPAPPRSELRRGVWIEIGEGLRLLWHNPFLRAFQLATATFDIFWNALYAVYILYVTRTLGLPPGAIGLIFGIGSAGALAGSLLAGRVARRFGLGPAIVGADLVVGLGSLLIPLALWLGWAALPLLIVAELLQAGANTIFAINRGSVAQAVTPARLRGRLGASQAFVGLGVALLGTFLGGVLGERIGIPATIVIGACGGLPAFVWLLFSPIRELREVPAAVDG